MIESPASARHERREKGREQIPKYSASQTVATAPAYAIRTSDPAEARTDTDQIHHHRDRSRGTLFLSRPVSHQHHIPPNRSDLRFAIRRVCHTMHELS